MAKKTSTATVVALTPARVSSDAAARYLGYEPQTLTNWRNLGKGPRFVRDGKPGSRVFYLVSDLDAWLDAQAERSISAV